jgi:hypothetical protein
MDPISFVAAFALSREPGPAPAPPAPAPRSGGAVGPAPESLLVPIRPEFGPVGDTPRPPLHDPDPAPPPAPPAPPVERAGVVPTTLRVPAAPAAPEAGPTPRTGGAGPTLWRLADATGQEWTHPDRRELERWVASRNAALAAWRVPSYSLPASGRACAGGRCPR